MAVDRAHHVRISEDVHEAVQFMTVEGSLGRENDENSPMLALTNVPERATILRPSQRMPLHDITHLFAANIHNHSSGPDNVRNPMDRVRRRPAGSSAPSKKRRFSELTVPSIERPSRHAFKSARQSAVLRSFR